jgi:hypothetical protein
MKILKAVDGSDCSDAVLDECGTASNAIIVYEWDADTFHRRVLDLEQALIFSTSPSITGDRLLERLLSLLCQTLYPLPFILIRRKLFRLLLQRAQAIHVSLHPSFV